jgi:hypothetical protein
MVEAVATNLLETPGPNLGALVEAPARQNFNTPLTLAGGRPAIISALPGWRPGVRVRRRFRNISHGSAISGLERGASE